MPGSQQSTTTTITTTEPSPCLLIWGGSSVTGQFLVQLASQAGVRTVTVGSSKTADLLRRLGATHAVVRDGKADSAVVDEVRALVGDDVTLGVDLVGARTAAATVQCLSRTRAARFAPLAAWAPVAAPANVEVLAVEMKQFVLDPASRVHADALTRLVAAGDVALPEIEVLPGGLAVVEEGLERLKRGDMAGKKLVIDMSE
jgi:NADPH:quinone reductase-like Zn-dependent oxidoreductase